VEREEEAYIANRGLLESESDKPAREGGGSMNKLSEIGDLHVDHLCDAGNESASIGHRSLWNFSYYLLNLLYFWKMHRN